MRYVIYGAGGIGSGIGAQLLQGGQDVVLIARGEHLRRMEHGGLTVYTPEGGTTLAVPVVGHPREIDFQASDVVFLSMKAQDTTAALGELRAVAGSGVPVVVAQNGVASERMAARRFRQVYAMLVFMPATFLEPGVVLLNGTPSRGVLDAGCYPSGVDSLIERVCVDLAAAGFLAEPTPHIMALKYGKLLLNLGNAVQALCGVGAQMRDLIHLLRQEGRACLEAAGIDYLTPRQLAERRAGKFEMGEIEGKPRQGGSTWQSLMRQRTSIEADYLNGEIVLLGSQHGVPTPYNQVVLDLVQKAAAEGRPPGGMKVEDLSARGKVEMGRPRAGE